MPRALNLLPEQLSDLDLWIAKQREPDLTQPELSADCLIAR